MGKTLYLECYSGISGDMTVAALLDLGADRKVLEDVLGSLPVQGFEIKISRVKKSGIDACDFNVILDKEIDGHDHDMEYLHGQRQEEKQEHEHEQEHEQEHKHKHEHSHDHIHFHPHRGMREIRQIIDASQMTEGARKTALAIFDILARAEANAHNVPIEEVHFHEVGAVDSIVDILSAAVCLDNLGVTEVIVPVLYEGTGTIRCQHGILPVPVPAVTNIVQQCGLELKITQVSGELVTPTGAAIVAAVRTSCKLPENFTIEKIGMGAGKRNYECPGILRAMLIHTEEAESDHSDHIYKLETNIDDCSGEILGFVMEKLFEAGARDVHYTPVYMKKNRPAWLLTVICKEEDIPGMEALIFAETTSIGIRRVRMERTILPRKKRNVMIPFGEVEVKICGPEGAQKCYPEYESLAKICRKTGISYAEAYQMAVEAGKNLE